MEAAVASAVAGDVGRVRHANRQRGGPPDLAADLVAHEDRFAGHVAHGIVRPGRELVLAAVDRPAVSTSFGGDLEAEGRARDDVDPGGGRPLALAEHGHVLAAVLCEPAETVEELR